MEKKTSPGVLIERAGGFRATSRRTRELSEDSKAVSVETIRAGLSWKRQWSDATKQRLAAAWGVEVGEVMWPGELGESGVPRELESIIEAEAMNVVANATQTFDLSDLDVLNDPELLRLGEEGSLRLLMLRQGSRAVDRIYRQTFGWQPPGGGDSDDVN